ncbi:MAG: hypothetical protein IE885_09315 [Campylobacterales bacterium]|nr:hypothetical protein [Campylobacterales bacterium]
MDKRKTKTAKLQNDIAKQFTSEIKPKIQPMVTEIYKRLGLDYFCMDCFIDKEMNLLVFEINVNIVFFDQTAENIFSKHIEKIREALIKMIDSKTSL